MFTLALYHLTLICGRFDYVFLVGERRVGVQGGRGKHQRLRLLVHSVARHDVQEGEGIGGRDRGG